MKAKELNGTHIGMILNDNKDDNPITNIDHYNDAVYVYSEESSSGAIWSDNEVTVRVPGEVVLAKDLNHGHLGKKYKGGRVWGVNLYRNQVYIATEGGQVVLDPNDSIVLN